MSISPPKLPLNGPRNTGKSALTPPAGNSNAFRVPSILDANRYPSAHRFRYVLSPRPRLVTSFHPMTCRYDPPRPRNPPSPRVPAAQTPQNDRSTDPQFAFFSLARRTLTFTP